MSSALKYEAEAKYPFKPSEGGYDHKAWAKRFVYRFKRGDRSLLDIQIIFAHQALELEIPKQIT